MGRLKTIVSILAFAILVNTDILTSGCSSVSFDIVFLLDTSDGPNRSPLYDKEKEFCKTTVSQLANGGNQFGLITFAHDETQQFKLGSLYSISDISAAIDSMWISTGKSDVVTSLSYAIDNGFQTGDRPSAPNVIVLLTHTGVNNASAVALLSEKLKSSYVELIVVEVGIHDSEYKMLSELRHLVIEVSDPLSLRPATTAITRFVCHGRGILQPWQPWSPCGATCGTGLRRRFRTCKKRADTDIDCDGDLMEQAICAAAKCTAPVDGGWSDWDRWSGCSKTCGGGTKSRARSCMYPPPENGGLPCPGASKQTKKCAEWSCPDCTRQCPKGGHLTPNCQICECSSVTLFGTVTGQDRMPLYDASIFLESRMYERFTGTNHEGYFTTFGICLMNDTVVIQKDGFAPAHVSATELNATHWTVTVALSQYVLPTFVEQPESKVRLVGQDVTLCCTAFGSPVPTQYEWMKNGRPLVGKGLSGSLSLSNVSLGDSGEYNCRVDTMAGPALSAKATLTVMGGNTDSCGSPQPKLSELPSGCYLTGDATKNSSIDIGTCGQKPCASRSLVDNGTCSDWWPHYCCDVKDVEQVSVSCEGFAYETSRIKSCQCTICSLKTTLRGLAVGVHKNGTRVPMQLGTIYVQGKRVAMTNMLGFFSFDVPQKLERIILDIRDELMHAFVDTTRVISISSGTKASIEIILPLRPKPVVFNTNIGVDVPLGDSTGPSPAGAVSIPAASLLSADGTPFHGSAKVSLHFVDPRKMEDLQAGNGDFVYETDGVESPLETFGMFALNVEDHHGNGLQVNKPIRCEMDASVFNISLNRDGEPDLSLWQYDTNKGIWIELTPMRFASSGSGRRLLETIVVGDFVPQNIPEIDLENENPVYGQRVVSWRWTNYDTPARYYDMYNKTTLGTVVVGQTISPKRDACFVSVSVYKDFSLKESAGTGIMVYAATKSKTDDKFRGFESRMTNDKGHVCLSIFCGSEVYLYAMDGPSRLTTVRTQDLPENYPAENIKNFTEIKFTSHNFEDSIDPITNTSRYSPVYYYTDRQRCIRDQENGYRFQFAKLTQEPKLNAVVGSDNIYDKKLSWYPVAPNKPSRWTCFIKVLVKIRENYDVRMLGTSYLYYSSRKDGSYGTYDVGPIPAPDFTDMETRAACVQYRCPGLVHDGGKDRYTVPTVVDVHLNYPKKCRFRTLATAVNITQLASGNGFQFIAESDINYGPRYGVFMNTNDAINVQNFCYNGIDTGQIGLAMKPTVNPAVEFDCL